MARRIHHLQQVPPDREMTAPYNFLPLTETAYLPSGEAPAKSSFQTSAESPRYSGVLSYKATALSPIYTRAAESTSGNTDASQFYHHGNPNRPYLPGSSMRGMVRSTLTLMAFGKFPRRKNRRLFFRSFSGGIMAELYSRIMVENCGRINGKLGFHQAYKVRSKSGFLVRETTAEGKVGESADSVGGWSIRPCWELRVHHRMLPSTLYKEAWDGDKVKVPDPYFQYREVWFKVEGESLEPGWHFHKAQQGGGMYSWRREVLAFQLEKPSGPAGSAWHSGWLVITGPMANKRGEFIFVEREGVSDKPVSRDVMLEAQDQDQITFWQERAFSEAAGRFTDQRSSKMVPSLPGLPIWYLEDNQAVVQVIGRAQNFRMRYARLTGDFVPNDVDAEKVLEPDLVESLFGRVNEEVTVAARKARDSANSHAPLWNNFPPAAISGRLRFDDAECISSQPLSEARIPNILASPKPTSFQLYLNQKSAEPTQLQHYSSEGEIRGTKVYWHRNKAGLNNSVIALPETDMLRPPRGPLGRQQTLVQPVKPGSEFRGRIHFENLEPMELGALLTAIELPDGLAHKSGMGKPLGMGSMQIRVEHFELIDRAARYKTWGRSAESTDDTKAVEARETNKAQAVRVQVDAKEQFRREMVRHNNGLQRTAQVNEDAKIWSLSHMRVLEIMLSWRNAPPVFKTNYVSFTGADARRWRERHILPGPHQVVGVKDPFSSIESAGDPSNARLADRSNAAPDSTPTSAPNLGQHGGAVASKAGAALTATSPSALSGPTLSALLGVQKMQLIEKLPDGRWLATHLATGIEIVVQAFRKGDRDNDLLRPGLKVKAVIVAKNGSPDAALLSIDVQS